MRFRNAAVAGLRGLALSVMSLAGSIALFVGAVVSISFIPLGLGVFTTPWVLGLVRRFAGRRRELGAAWCEVRIPAAYRPFPVGTLPGVGGQPRKCVHLMKDPATWRDLRWLVIDMTAGFLTALLPAALLVYPLEGYALAAGLWRVFTDGGIGYWYGFVPIRGQASAVGAGALGTALLVLGLFVNPRLLRVHFLLTRAVLAPRRTDLEQRVERLTKTRHDAVDTSAAELRRIERDLHDGAQARLVAVGMSLGTVEALIEKNPAKARELLAKARADSADALGELRDLVRGIHPPVLAERGLAAAAEALALRMPIPVEARITLPGRAAESVESAAYFAISEVLTNAAKHSGADQIRLDLDHRDGALRIIITDNGRGGATVSGSGLAGIDRRLGAFDGVLVVDSPLGGPTTVTMEIPCALLSREASPSS
ncbi:sensor histidine kinase [Streptomyces sp. AK02-01A]|uniref:sensor histidine kinase n=1 Tax=Streptomyces sp. AK02-01A TaxID=3028648 RepID=UPI0029BA67CD|nr:sensor domain-containing protein [Streptomyces sp. AK02-01A]MDX3852356.1 histidine kinase [Streptomyces sp. AK02-01A]